MKCITNAIRAEIAAQFDKWMPRLIEAVKAELISMGAETVGEVVDEVTDRIPGEVDDRLIDPLMAKLLKTFGFSK